MTDIQSAIYTKCMKLAAQANKNFVPSKKELKLIKKHGFVICLGARYWIELWNDFCKGKINEEEIKWEFQKENIYN